METKKDYLNLNFDEWFKDTILSKRTQKINHMYTRENYKYFKRNFPNGWAYVVDTNYYNLDWSPRITEPNIYINDILYNNTKRPLTKAKLNSALWKMLAELNDMCI